MTFNITLVESGVAHNSEPRCEIQIDDHRESCPLLTDLWTLDTYKAQWKKALRYLYERKVRKAMLVTDIRPKAISDAAMFWALYAEEAKIFVREMFLREVDPCALLNPIVAEKLIPDRDNDDQSAVLEYEVSEWMVNFDDIRHLVLE